MLKDDRLGESFYILVGEEFNKPTNMGQECSDTNLVKRYKSLCIDNSKNIAYRDD